LSIARGTTFSIMQWKNYSYLVFREMKTAGGNVGAG